MIDTCEKYSFDDEVANKFYYNAQEKEIKIYFPGCYKMEERINKESVLIIKKWDDAKSKLCAQNCYRNLEKYLGIISMILHLELKGKNVQLTVTTIDDRYVDFVFCNPQIDVQIM